MPARRASLVRIHRVRTLQLGLARADEVRAHEQAASETALGERIAALAAATGTPPVGASAVSLGAAAHYRDRLHQSADAAAVRAAAAAARVTRAAETTRAARQDQSAVEKLLERVDAEALVRAGRALEETPAAAGQTARSLRKRL